MAPQLWTWPTGWCFAAAATSPQSSASRLRETFGLAPQRSTCWPEPGRELGRARIGGRRQAVERRDGHDAPHRVREEQAPPSDLAFRVATLLDAGRQLQHARPSDARQNPQVERRRAQHVAVPPEHAPHRAFRHEPIVREQQGVVHFGPLGLGGGDDEAVSLGRLVGIGPMWLGGGDHRRRLERRRGTYRHAGASIAYLETEYGIAGRRKRRYQSDEILRGFGQAELVRSEE